MKISIAIFILLLSYGGFAQKITKLTQIGSVNITKGLSTIDDKSPEERQIMHLDSLANACLLNNNVEEAIRLYKEALEIAEKIGKKSIQAEILPKLGKAYYIKNDFQAAILSYESSIKIYTELKKSGEVANCEKNIAVVYYSMNRLDKSAEYYNNALSKNIKLKDYGNSTILGQELSVVYFELQEYEKAIAVLSSIEECAKKTEEADYDIMLMNSKAIVYSEMKNFSAAMQNYSLASGAKKISALAKSNVMNNIANILYYQNQYDEASEIYNQAIDIKKTENDNRALAITHHNLGNCYYKQKKLNKAVEQYTLSNALSEKLKLVHLISRNYLMLSEITSSECKSDSNFIKLLSSSFLSMFRGKQIYEFINISLDLDKSQLVQELNSAKEQINQQKILSVAKDREIEIMQVNSKLEKAESKQKNTIIYSLIICFIFLTLLVLILISKNIQKRRANNILSLRNAEIMNQKEEIITQNEALLQQKEEIEAQRDEIKLQRNEIELQKEELQSKNKDMTDSIVYAQRIQRSVLPSNSLINSCFAENFIIYMPRDIVSGDFFWCKQIHNLTYLVAADCTGHGIPGAFMSMLGISLLNEIVGKRDVNPPAFILNELRKRIKKLLHQTGKDNEQRDGMDIVLCSIEKNIDNYTVTYTGAKRPLLVKQANEPFITLSADRRSIGGAKPKRKHINFTDQSINLQTNDILILFSDGITDQPAPNRKRFTINRLIDTLNENANLSTTEFCLAIEVDLFKHRKDTEQRDDITLIGIKLK